MVTAKKPRKKSTKKEQFYQIKNDTQNGWTVVDNAHDIVALEKKTKTLTIRIEARLVDNRWNIFKSYYDTKNFNHVEEYFAESISETLDMIERLKNEKELSKKQIMQLREQQAQDISVQVRRVFKELDSEKWMFTINREKANNFFIINYEDSIQIDIVLFEKYMHHEDKIVSDICTIMGIDKYEVDTVINIFYFAKRKKHIKNHPKKSVMVGKIDIGFSSKE